MGAHRTILVFVIFFLAQVGACAQLKPVSLLACAYGHRYPTPSPVAVRLQTHRVILIDFEFPSGFLTHVSCYSTRLVPGAGRGDSDNIDNTDKSHLYICQS